MTLDPLRDEWPLAPTDEEQRIATALLGERIISIEYEVDADWEAAFLRLPDRTVAVAAVDVAGRWQFGRTGAGWPWRIALLTVGDELPAMTTAVADPGVVESVVFYVRDEVEAAVAIRLEREVVWLACAGGDAVAHATGEMPSNVAAMRQGRRLPL